MGLEQEFPLVLPVTVEQGVVTAFGSSLDTLERASAPLMGWAAEVGVVGLPWRAASSDVDEPCMPSGALQPRDEERLLALILVDVLLRGGEGGRISDLARGEGTQVAFARALCRLRRVNLPWAKAAHLTVPGFAIPSAFTQNAARYAGWVRRHVPAGNVADVVATAAWDLAVVAGNVDNRRWMAAALHAEAFRQNEHLKKPVRRYLEWWGRRHGPSARR